MKQILRFDNWFGGFSKSLSKTKDSEFYFGKGLDIMGDIDVIRPQRTQTETAAEITTVANIRGFAMGIVSSAEKLFGYGQVSADDNDIQIYSRSATASSENWAIAATETTTKFPNSGFTLEDGTYIYFWGGADGSTGVVQKIRKIVPSSGSVSDVGTVAGHDAVADEEGPMLLGSNGKYYFSWYESVGMVSYLASWDGTTFLQMALDLPVGYKIRSVFNYNYYCGILAYTTRQNKSALFIWDWVSDSFIEQVDIPSGNVLFARVINKILYIFADENGKLIVYRWTGGRVEKIKSYTVTQEMTGLSTDVTSIEVYDNAVDVRNGIIYFGASFIVSATTGLSGIFAFGSYDSEFPLALWHDRLVKTTVGTSLVRIYAIKWTKPTGSTYPTLWISYCNLGDGEVSPTVHLTRTTTSSTTYETGSFVETPMLDFGMYHAKIPLVYMTFNPLPANTALVLKYKVDDASTWTTLETANTEDLTFIKKHLPGTFYNLRFRIEFTTNTTSGCPELIGLYGEGDLLRNR